MINFKIAGHPIGGNYSPNFISEIGINLEVSLDAAISAGTEIIKYQKHVVEDEMSDEDQKEVPANADDCHSPNSVDKYYCQNLNGRITIMINYNA